MLALFTHAVVLPSGWPDTVGAHDFGDFGANQLQGYPAHICPWPTLQGRRYRRPHMVRGQDGSLLLSSMTLAFTTSRRFIPTLSRPGPAPGPAPHCGMVAPQESSHGLIDDSYDCVDRIVLNAYFAMGQDPGGMRVLWRALHGSGEGLDTNHLNADSGALNRRVHAYAKASGISTAKAVALSQHYAFHIWDADWGPVTSKMSGHPPQAGIQFGKQANCFVHTPVGALAKIADTLSEPQNSRAASAALRQLDL